MSYKDIKADMLCTIKFYETIGSQQEQNDGYIPCKEVKEFIDELESCQEVSTVLDLDDTCKMMSSADYKERFIAEYKQTKIRYEKLHKMIVKYEAGTLDFTPTCPIELLKEQASYMGKYLYILEVRAQLEGVNLNG